MQRAAKHLAWRSNLEASNEAGEMLRYALHDNRLLINRQLMFLPIFLFELKYRLRRPATWIYFLVLALLSGLLVALAGGAFGSGIKISLGGDGQTVKINSPFSLSLVVSTISVFGIIIASSLMGNSVYRDFETQSHSLFYTKPLSKWG